MKWLSLFSGIGGFDLALVRQGHEIVAACEIDKYARTVYARHFPGVPIHKDATKLTGDEFGEIDGICAGFPCQAFSVAGKQFGFEDARGTLFYEIARLARQKRPQVLFLENVMGLLGHAENRTILTIFKILNELGYDLEWQGINGKYFLPQNRPRIYIIGTLRGKSKRKVFPFIGDDKKTIIKCNQLNNPRHSTHRVYGIDGVARTLKAVCGNKTGFYAIPVLTPKRPIKRQNGRRFKENGEPAFTLTVQDQHGIYDGCRVRVLTPLECERIQGFPDNWTEGLSDTRRWNVIGNAVMVPKIEKILERLK